MIDAFARKIDYMRLSITDRCNLRCKYCMPEDVECISHDNVLRLEEIHRLCAIMAKLGVKTIRLTGGEPLVRKGWLGFARELKAIKGVENITLTTNGILLEEHLEELKELGITKLNISLDTLDPDIYEKITGSNAFTEVSESIMKALHMGMNVKINCVPLAGINDHEIIQIAQLTERLPIDVRFIEMMPTEVNGGLVPKPIADVMSMIKAHYPDLKDDSYFTTLPRGFGPAKYYKTTEMLGSIGFIASISDIFCSTCNRIRLSSDGFLTLCLHHRKGVDLKKLLRGGASDAEIEEAVKAAIMAKPEKHHMKKEDGQEVNLKHMSRIGG